MATMFEASPEGEKSTVKRLNEEKESLSCWFQGECHLSFGNKRAVISLSMDKPREGKGT